MQVRLSRRNIRLNLALQGGGAHGAFTWGVLDRMLEDDELEISWVSATSAGAVNAAAVASGLSTGGKSAARNKLRGVWEAAPYFSDGSARSLEAVLARTDPDAEKVHAPGNAERPPAFTADERLALLAFLRAL